MVWMICESCRISFHSQSLPVGDEYIPQRQLCPKCGKHCADTDIVYYSDDETADLLRRCASRLSTLNIIKAKYQRLYELADWTGQVPLVRDWAYDLHSITTAAVHDIKQADRQRKKENDSAV